jgi:hypothetical protein
MGSLGAAGITLRIPREAARAECARGGEACAAPDLLGDADDGAAATTRGGGARAKLELAWSSICMIASAFGFSREEDEGGEARLCNIK